MIANEKEDDIYLVLSKTGTGPAKLIYLRVKAAKAFFNDEKRYEGMQYSHASISKNSLLGGILINNDPFNNDMMSFARRDIHNTFNAGLIIEDVRTGIFAFRPLTTEIAVFKLSVSTTEYKAIVQIMNEYWAKAEEYDMNFSGLATQLLIGKSVAPDKKFFCSQWIATILQEVGINLFPGKRPEDVRPFEYYPILRERDPSYWEGLATDYPEYGYFEPSILRQLNIRI